MHYGAFSVQVNFLPGIADPASVRFSNYSVGRASGTNPVFGAATWTGVAIGMDLNRLIANPDVLQGDAAIEDEGNALVRFPSLIERTFCGTYILASRMRARMPEARQRRGLQNAQLPRHRGRRFV